MNIKYKYLFCLFLGFINIPLYSQSIELSFEKVVYELCLASTDARKIDLSTQQEVLNWKNFQLSKLPSIKLSLNPLSFNQSIKSLQIPQTGEYNYVNDYSNNTNLGFNISQPINLTGGKLTLSSNLNILTEFSRNTNSFSATPLNLGYQQSIIGGRKSYKFESKIRNLSYHRISKMTKLDTYKLQQRSVEFYMRALVAKILMDNGCKNSSIADTLFKISVVKYRVGDITESDYIQAELQLIMTKRDTENACREYKNTIRALAIFLGITHDNYTVAMPDFPLPEYIDYETAIMEIRANNPFYIDKDIKTVQYERQLYSSKIKRKINADISINYGLNQFGSEFYRAYRNLNSRQSITLGFVIPIIDWGIGRNSYVIEKNQYEYAMIDVERSEIDMLENLRLSIENYNSNILLLQISKRSYELSQKQYLLLMKSFELGQASLLDISNAQRQLIDVEQSYSSTLYQTWSEYYSIRALTLSDCNSPQ